MLNLGQKFSSISAPNSGAYFCSLITKVGRNVIGPGWKQGYRSSKKRTENLYLLWSSFRSLSISSKIGKLFERLVEQRLRKWIEENNSISLTQDFRPKKSTVSSPYSFNVLIEKTIRKRKPVALLNIDMEKAFDSVWINGMIYKLKEKRVVEKLFAILHSFPKKKQNCLHTDW